MPHTWGRDTSCYHMAFLPPQEAQRAWQGLELQRTPKPSSTELFSGAFIQHTAQQQPLSVGPCGVLPWYVHPCPQPRICWELPCRLLGTHLCGSLPSGIIPYTFQTFSSPELQSLPLLLRRLLCSAWAPLLGPYHLEGFSRERTRVNVSLILWASFVSRFWVLCCLMFSVWK